jgi:hypothetical protein
MSIRPIRKNRNSGAPISKNRHSDRSAPIFSSSFAPANESGRVVEESLPYIGELPVRSARQRTTAPAL